MINDLKLIENIDILFKTKVVLYGAGTVGRSILEELRNLGIEPVCFCDSDYNKCVSGGKVISPQKLKLLDSQEEIAVIITSVHINFIDQIINIIDSLNLRTENIFTNYALETSILLNLKKKSANSNEKNIIELKKALEYNNISNNLILKVLRCLTEQKNVLVYQPGKVASTTICNSLSLAGVSNTHIHKLACINKDAPFLNKKQLLLNHFLYMNIKT